VPVATTVAPAGPLLQPDVVFLRNGGMLRGRILELLPGHSVTIAIETGQVRVLVWDAVERVLVAPTPQVPLAPGAAPSVAPAPAPSTDTPSPPMRGPLVHVHIASSKHVILNRRIQEGGAWAHACDSPCDQDLPLGDEYEIAGLGSGPTSAFRLRGEPGQSLTITVSPPSVGGEIAGGVLIGAGALVGYVTLFVALVESACPQGSGCDMTGAAVMGLSSLGAIALGAVIVGLSAGTDISQSSASAMLPQPRASSPFLREPIWKTREASELPEGPSFVVPLFTKTF
jgi:hypothetical protein